MACFSNKKKTVDLYFDAWKHHDGNIIKLIFADNAKYVINAETRFIGVQEILAYWDHNAIRQKDITISYEIDSNASDHTSASFVASFYDCEEMVSETIDGEIHFYFENNRIVVLAEWYIKL